MGKLSNTLLNNQWVKEVTREIRKYLKINENGNTIYKKNMGSIKIIAKREV